MNVSIKNCLMDVLHDLVPPQQLQSQLKQVVDYCERGVTVTVSTDFYPPVTGKIVQFFSVYVRSLLSDGYGFMMKVEGDPEVKRVNWRSFMELRAEDNPDNNVRDTTKKLVSQALKCPQWAGACHNLMAELESQNRTMEEVLDTLDRDLSQLLACRLMRELVAKGKLEQAEALYERTCKKNSGYANYIFLTFDLCMAILALEKAGSKTPSEDMRQFARYSLRIDDLLKDGQITENDAMEGRLALG